MAQNPYQPPQQLGGITVPAFAPLVPWQEPTRTKILNIVRNQRWVNLHFLIIIVAAIVLGVTTPQGKEMGEGPVATLLIALLIPNMLCLIYRVYKLSSALEYSVPVLVAIASIAGIIGIVIIALLSNEANKYLKQFNIQVGLLGANPNTVEQMINQAQQAAQAANPPPVAQAWNAPPR